MWVRVVDTFTNNLNQIIVFVDKCAYLNTQEYVWKTENTMYNNFCSTVHDVLVVSGVYTEDKTKVHFKILTDNYKQFNGQ